MRVHVSHGDLRDERTPKEPELRSLLARARPLLAEVLSVWPANKRRKLVLWVEARGAELEVNASLPVDN
jgi:hypothetical protein